MIKAKHKIALLPMRVMNVDLTTHYYFACHWLVIHLIGEYPTQNLTVTKITNLSANIMC